MTEEELNNIERACEDANEEEIINLGYAEIPRLIKELREAHEEIARLNLRCELLMY